MRRRTALGVSVIVATTLVALFSIPAHGQAGGPVLDYLQNVIKPMLDTIKGSVAGSPRIIGFKSQFVSNENSAAGVNFDYPLLLDQHKVKRYTVTLTTSALALAPAGVDTVEIMTCTTIDATTFSQVPVMTFDPAGRFGGVTAGPYAGTNAFVRVTRGADGRGPVTQQVNVYIEIEP